MEINFIPLFLYIIKNIFIWIMKSFNGFLKEGKDEKINTKNLSYDEFLSSIIDSMKKDFKRTEKQAVEFTILYRDLLKDAWENQYTTREAIASTKIPGVKYKEGNTNESCLFDIDYLYEEYLNKIKLEKKPINIEAYVESYFNRFKLESFSDKRIHQRIKNNYARLISLANNKILEMTYTKDDETFHVDVLERNDDIIDKIIDNFSFRYKKRKIRYIRPSKITGKTLYKDIDLQIFLSNKDVIRIEYDNLKETDELKISINDKLYYHMDYIQDIDIVKKAIDIYEVFLKMKNFIILKKTNPFE